MTIIKLLSIIAALMVAISGCGGGGGGSSGGTIPIEPPNPGINQAPTISSISPDGRADSPVRIPVSSTQQIVVAASDPDHDPLTYTWAADNGTVSGSNERTTFSAPATPCNAVVTVQVSDGKGLTASGKCYFTVYKGNDPPPPDPDQNQAPVIVSVIANPDAVDVDGTSVITAVATDADGDQLSYTWVANGGGVQSQSGNTITWKAPSIAGSCSVTVFVSDGNNPAVSKSVAISVAGVVQPPVTNGLTGTYVQNSHSIQHPDLSKGTVVFTRIDPTINFDWGRKAPDPRLITIPEIENGHDFGVIWRGYIKCEQRGTYAFKGHYDDGLRLWISDDSNKMQMVIDGWFTGPVDTTGRITLQGGKWYKLEAQYFEDEDRSYVQLYWLPPGTSGWAIVPTNVLRTN